MKKLKRIMVAGTALVVLAVLVGCGKTVVALHALAAAADGGFQTALMASTTC